MEAAASSVTLSLLAVLGLVLANGFFVAAEFSLVAVRRSRVDQLVAEGRAGAVRLKRAVDHLDAHLAATQLGITMSSIALGWIGEPALSSSTSCAGCLGSAMWCSGRGCRSRFKGWTVAGSTRL